MGVKMSFIQVDDETLLNVDAIRTIEKDELLSDYAKPFLIVFHYMGNYDDTFEMPFEEERERDRIFEVIINRLIGFSEKKGAL